MDIPGFGVNWVDIPGFGPKSTAYPRVPFVLRPWGSETPPDIPGFVRCGSQPAGYPRVLVRAACERAGYPRVRSKLLPISSVIPARGFVPPLGECGNPLISYLVPAAGINLGPIKFPPARSTPVPLEINPSLAPSPYQLQPQERTDCSPPSSLRLGALLVTALQPPSGRLHHR